MKATTLSMLVVLALMVAVPMWFLGSGSFTGKSGSDSTESLKKKAPKGVKAVVTDRKVEIYKWIDKYGVPQFSETAPADGSEAKMIVLSPDTNVMDAFKIPKKEEEKEKKGKVFSLGSPYSPEGMKDMVDESLQLKDKINEQQTEQEAMIEKILNQK
jgi:hypothetical protein